MRALNALFLQSATTQNGPCKNLSSHLGGVPDLAAHAGAAADGTDDPRRAAGTLPALVKEPILA